MRPIVDIAGNTFRAILRNKVLYLALFLLILIVALMALPFAMMRLAGEAGEQDLARQMQARIILSTFGLWYTATLAVAVFLGATAISSEVSARTIVTVLAKPVERWRFLTGKWAGIQVFLHLFLAFGTLLTAGVLRLIDVRPSALFWLGILGSFVVVTLISSLALLLATCTSPVFAGGATVLLGLITPVIGSAVDNPSAWLRWPAQAYYYLAPAQAPGRMLTQSLQVDLLNPEYSLYAGVIAENLLYGLGLLVLSCALFTVREVRVR